MNKNKNKGKAFERQVTQLLNEIFNLNFERVPNSGAFTGGKNKVRENKLTPEQSLLSGGDIIMPNELKHFIVECKSYKNINWNGMLVDGGCKLLNKWIDQANENTNNRIPLIFFKINNQGTFIAYEYNHHSCRNFFCDCHILYNYNDKTYMIGDLREFLEFNRGAMLDVPSWLD